MEIEGGTLDRLLFGVGMDDLEMHRMPAARRGRQKRGRRHVAEEAGGLGAAVVGDAADTAGGDDEQEFIAS